MQAGRLTWGVEYDDEARQGPEELEAADMRLCDSGVDAGDAGDVAHRALLREYLRAHGSRARAWRYLSGSLAMARWHVNARTNGGLAGSYVRVGPAGRVHCSTCAGTAETTVHTHLHCPLHIQRAPSGCGSFRRLMRGGRPGRRVRSLGSQRRYGTFYYGVRSLRRCVVER
jgi:hypothetical protein